jgi:hypothetical protein
MAEERAEQHRLATAKYGYGPDHVCSRWSIGSQRPASSTASTAAIPNIIASTSRATFEMPSGTTVGAEPPS